MEYEDGAIKIFLNTKGNVLNTSQELQKMLKYIESSVAENVTDENIQAIHNYVKEVKKDKEVEVQYMKSWEVEQLIREEAQAEGIEETLRAVELKNEGYDTVEKLMGQGISELVARKVLERG